MSAAGVRETAGRSSDLSSPSCMRPLLSRSDAARRIKTPKVSPVPSSVFLLYNIIVVSYRQFHKKLNLLLFPNHSRTPRRSCRDVRSALEPSTMDFYPDSISRIRFMSLQNVLLRKAEDESLDFHYTFYFFTRIRPSFLHKLTL